MQAKFYVYLDGLVTNRGRLLRAFELIDQLYPELRLLSNDFG